ncbi:MAG: shikimate kinase [Propionibacterium sp.]|nr:shikimate kinase [Propionibacterium sp.]
MSIALIGVPGAGKTTVGRALADRLGKSFVDVDQRNEEVLGKPIAEVFVDEGEPYFRQVEESATLELLESTDVVSLGGGAIMNERIREALQAHEVIWLQVSVGQGSRRVGMNTVRPLMLGNVRGKLIELTRERTPFYESAATHAIDTDGREPEQIVDEIAGVLRT